MAFIQIDFQSMCLKRHVKLNAFIPIDGMLLPGMEPPKVPLRQCICFTAFPAAVTVGSAVIK